MGLPPAPGKAGVGGGPSHMGAAALGIAKVGTFSPCEGVSTGDRRILLARSADPGAAQVLGTMVSKGLVGGGACL